MTNNIEKQKDNLVQKLSPGHYTCEDCWYSCPASGDEYCGEDTSGKCNCGRNEKIEEIKQALKETREETLREVVDRCELKKEPEPELEGKDTDFCKGYNQAQLDLITHLKHY